MIELTRLTNIGLKISDNLTIPAIRAIVTYDNPVVSAADANALFLEIFNRAGGMVTLTSYGTGKRNDVISELNSDSNFSYGSLTKGWYVGGYSRTYASGNRFYSAAYDSVYYAQGTGGLYYNGNRIADLPIYSGYSNYEYSHLVILTDENYNLIHSTSNSIKGMNIRSSEQLGIAYKNNAIVCAVTMLGQYTNFQQDSWNLVVAGNIKNDITNELDPEITDPYNPGGESGTGGGTGSFDGTGDNIDIPGLPTFSAVDTGFITLFNPSASELRNLANYMWGDLFDLDTWKKIFADPMDAILGLSIVPVNVPSSGSSVVTIGNISTGVSMTKASSQYVSVDCGTINVNEYWGAYLDYSPYTQAEIYLPFIGIHPLAIDDIMGKPVHVVYHIDVLSGACCAYVKCGGSVLYSFVGQCSCSIPITANDWTNVINGALSIAGAIGSMVASGGATAPMAVSSMASTAVNSLKPNVEKSGSMGGMGGMLGVQTPYIILTRPKQALPAKQNMFTGYPSYITKKLSDCSGYTEVESIHLENVPATDNELSEITNLLKSGVII